MRMLKDSLRRLIFYEGLVAEQMHECINVKNPPNCVGGIRAFFLVSFLASLLLALLLKGRWLQKKRGVGTDIVIQSVWHCGDRGLF
jgi:hypothetical protein